LALNFATFARLRTVVAGGKELLLRKKRAVVVPKRGKAAFDPKIFLAKAGEGKTISRYRKDQIVYSQGEVADAVFYIQQGKVKLTVVSEQGKEAVIAILGPGQFLAKDV
jgi:CRP/FNR family transcriptional regulator, cyclic AMP receptor protein